MKPDLELVGVRRGNSTKHGYPFRTVRWQFHPEYEIHADYRHERGRSFVADHIGTFEPGTSS